MRKTLRITFIAIAVFSISVSFSQDSLSNLQTESQSSDNPESYDQLEEQIASLKEEIENDNLFTWLAAGIGSIIGGLIVWYAQKPVKQRFRELELDVDKRIENLLKERERVIANTFEKTRLEESLKKNVKFKVIGLPLSGTSLYGILKTTGLDMRNSVENDDYDLLVINNEQNKGLKIMRGEDDSPELLDAMRALNDMSEEQVALYYNDTRVQFPSDRVERSNRGRINFATNASQVYGNLMSSLIYQHSLRS